MLTRARKGTRPERVNRRSVAEIHLGNLAANLRRVKQIVNNSRIIAVVKADAYGHGAVRVSQRLVSEGVDALGVACISEAAELRDAGIAAPIVVFFDNNNIDEYFHYDLEPVIFDEGMIERFSDAARRYSKKLTVHLKVDTGMGRVGFRTESAYENVGKALSTKGLNVRWMMSHFSEADLQDRGFARSQLKDFNSLLNRVNSNGAGVEGHMANSAAVLTLPESHLGAVRPGLMLYGYSPVEPDEQLTPVMRVKTSLIAVRKVPANTPVSYGRTFVTKRESVIGVMPVGYADGFFRAFSNNGSVLIKGKKAPIAGRVCMDLTMVDLTGIDGVTVGDEVVVMSGVDGPGLNAAELAEKVHTISYEMMTSLGGKARKEYVE